MMKHSLERPCFLRIRSILDQNNFSGNIESNPSEEIKPVVENGHYIFRWDFDELGVKDQPKMEFTCSLDELRNSSF